jgi:hypothetical protein
MKMIKTLRGVAGLKVKRGRGMILRFELRRNSSTMNDLGDICIYATLGFYQVNELFGKLPSESVSIRSAKPSCGVRLHGRIAPIALT